MRQRGCPNSTYTLHKQSHTGAVDVQIAYNFTQNSLRIEYQRGIVSEMAHHIIP